MSQDHNTKPIKALINDLLKAYGMESKMNEMELIHVWEDIMGKTIASRTREIKLQGGVLHVKLNSAALRHTLGFSKQEMLDKLNEALKGSVVNEIVIK